MGTGEFNSGGNPVMDLHPCDGPASHTWGVVEMYP